MQDEKIKQMLEDVEVPAPRRVWRNVAAQLDEAAAPVVAGRDWIKWTGMAVAFAALVVGAFLFVPRSSSEEPIPTYQNITAAQSARISPVVEESEPAVQEQAIIFADRMTPVAGKNETAVATPVDLPEFKEETVELEQPVLSAQPIRKDNHAQTKAEEPDGSAAEEFERMAREDEKRFSRGIKSLYAQGSIGGNDSDISFSANRARLSSGISIKKTGITELGESKFGIPVSFGIGFRFYILPNFSVGSGLDYSLLSRTFDGLYEEVNNAGLVISSETGSVHHTMHYLGIPLNIYYDIISADKIKFYAYGGGEAEFCLNNHYNLYTNSGSYIHHTDPVEKMQWSIGVGLGVEFKLSNLVGLYLDPSAKYYFPCYQPKNIRTERPLMFNFDAGLRFNF